MSTINGIGSTFHGCAEPGRDGSFITTKWLTVIIPILPLGSYRVRPLSSSGIPLVFSSTEFESQSVPLYWPHVIYIYAVYIAAAILLFATMLFAGPKFTNKVSNPFLASVIAVALSVAALKLSHAIRKASTFVNLIAIALVLLFSFAVGLNLSGNPEATTKYLYIVWGAYIAYFLYGYFSEDDNTEKEQKREV